MWRFNGPRHSPIQNKAQRVNAIDLHGTIERSEAAEGRQSAWVESAMSDDPALIGDALSEANNAFWLAFVDTLTPLQRAMIRERCECYASDNEGRL